MEDYEKKYKDALAKAREIHRNEDEKRFDMEWLFPELKENKDEKVRNALIRFHKSTIDVDGIKGADIIAWLEKQGSSSIKWQKNTPENKPTINHSVLIKTTQGIAEGEWNGKEWFQFRWSSNIKDSDVLGWMELSDLDEQGEQKPTVVDFNAKDWYVSKVDGKIHDMTYNPADKVEPIFSIGDVLCDKSCTTLDKNSQPNIEILDIRDGMYICNNCTFPIEQQDEYELVTKRIEPQSAWSNEDEEHLRNCTGAIWAADYYLYEDKQDMEAWLKSLKDRIG